MRADAFEEDARQLARNLISNGLVPISQSENAELRSLVVWGILQVSFIKQSGKVSSRLLSLPEDKYCSAQQSIWQSRVMGCSPDFDQLLENFCEWSIKKHLKVYGPTAISAAEALKAEILGAICSRNLFSTWRRLYERWLLPDDVGKMARRIYGPTFSIEDANKVLANLDLAKSVKNATPSLLPLLGWVFNQKASSLEHKLFGRAVNSREFFDGFRQGMINYYQKTPNSGTFSPASWRLLSKQSASIVRSIVRPDLPSIPEMLPGLHLLAMTGEVKIPKVVVDNKLVYSEMLTETGNYTDQKVRYLRLLINEVRKAHRKEATLSVVLDQSTRIYDWLRFQGFDEGCPLKNSTWRSLLRNQEDWHRFSAWNDLFDDTPLDSVWDSPLPSMIIDGCDISPLCSVRELRDEGDEMHHCIISYRHDCMRGISRIFSIKSKDGRSTLELRQGGGAWDIAQHRGVSNCESPIEHQRVAVKLLYLFQDTIGRIDR